jgi:molybdenum-dependent DNA-binding transcriptional regulator ModE
VIRYYGTVQNAGKTMSESFKIIYKILSTLEKSMDYPEFDPNSISAKTIGTSEERWRQIIKMLVDNNYIEDVSITTYIHEKVGTPDVTNAKITLKGLEYLQENSMMKKAYKLAKGIKDVTPGM